jgi:hypothetical protein
MKIAIECEEGDDFQEYVYADSGVRVKKGTTIGYEEDGELHLHPNIFFK